MTSGKKSSRVIRGYGHEGSVDERGQKRIVFYKKGLSVMRLRTRIMAILAGLTVSMGAWGMTTPATAGPDTHERALSIMGQGYNGFKALKASGESPFDWSSDGCSWTPLPWSWEQDLPCQQHDFGYRNFGKGLRLERTEDRRGWIDNRFLAEMLQNCRDHWWYPNCEAGAYSMYSAVRNFNDWRD